MAELTRVAADEALEVNRIPLVIVPGSLGLIPREPKALVESLKMPRAI
jgi:hypothetical protein